MRTLPERDAYAEYDDMLNEMYPLDGIACNHFSTLLLEGDPIAYNCGFSDWCDSQDIKIEE